MPDTTDNAPAAKRPDSEIDALIKKHRREIDRIKTMSSKDQQEVFSQLGVDPKAIEAHYPELEKKSAELRREDNDANRKTAASGIASVVAGAVGAFALTEKFPLGSKIARGFAIPITSLASGLAGTFAASRIFSGKIRDDARKLAFQANNVFERELAVALENREREMAAAASTPVAPVEKPAVVAPDVNCAQVTAEKPAATVPQRDASFAAQAAADKAAINSAETHRA